MGVAQVVRGALDSSRRALYQEGRNPDGSVTRLHRVVRRPRTASRRARHRTVRHAPGFSHATTARRHSRENRLSHYHRKWTKEWGQVKAAGCAVGISGSDWLSAGDFDGALV